LGSKPFCRGGTNVKTAGGGEREKGGERGERRKVIVEVRAPRKGDLDEFLRRPEVFPEDSGFEITAGGIPMVIEQLEDATLIAVQGTIPPEMVDRLEASPAVVKVWSDPKVSLHGDCNDEEASHSNWRQARLAPRGRRRQNHRRYRR
jgi:hypothetical protein